ncbi:MAG: hypothetical protein ACI9Y7_000909 [Dokdonia sp.]|jgi:hypothetical protein
MKKLNATSEELSLKRTKIARLNNAQMSQIAGGNQPNVSTEEILTSSWKCLTSLTTAFVDALTSD